MKVKRIIDGKLYDTKQATLIAESRYEGASDDEHYKEALYRNDYGVLFLAAEGGVESFYAALLQDGKPTRGTDVIPVTATEALRWLEDHDHLEEIETLFGKQPQAGYETLPIDLRVSPKLKARIELMAAMENLTVNDWLSHLIERELE